MTTMRGFGRHSLRFKFALAGIVVEVIVLSAMVWNSNRIAENALREVFQSRVQSLIPLLNVSLTNPLLQRDYATLDERLGRIVQPDSLVYIEVSDELNQMVAQRGALPPTSNLDATFDSTDGIYNQAFDITLAGRVIGHARYGLNVSVLKATQSKQRIQGMALALAAITLTFLVLVALAHVLTRRLRELAQAAQTIQTGDYSVRVAEDGRDEVAVATQAFNAMTQAIQRDISQRKLAEEKLRRSEANLAITLHSIGDAVIATDAWGQITLMNPAAERLTGWRLAEALGQPLTQVFRIINAQTRLPAANPVQLVMKSGEVVGLANHTALLARDGQEYQIFDSGAPIRNEAGQIIGMVLVFSDVTEKYRMEAMLAMTAERLSLATRAGGVGIWEWDVIQNMSIWDNVMCQLYGITADQFGGAYEAWRKGVHPDDQARSDAEIQMALRGETEYNTEFRVVWPDGSIHTLRALAVVQRDENGQPLKMIGTNWDITAHKQAEQSLQTSLKEKTALLNEVHHRVKNNLQIITSLLRLESGRSTQPDIKAVLGDMQGRIRAMALLHESLYRSGSLAAVDLSNYLKQLATQSFRALLADMGSVQLHLDLAAVKVSMDLAVPCGLIVNELISNCLKHGFPDGRTGEVSIVLKPLNDGQWCLCVSDTGLGLPDDFEARQKKSLGLQLVNSLAIQLGGSLKIGPGAVFAVSFTVTAPATIAMEVG